MSPKCLSGQMLHLSCSGQTKIATAKRRPHGGECLIRGLTACLDDVLFEIAQRRELPMERSDRHRVGKRITASLAAAANRCVKLWTQHDVVDGLREISKWGKEPRTYDPVHDHKVISSRVALSSLCQHGHHAFVLFMCLGQIRRDGSLTNEMPEVISMEMNGCCRRRAHEAERRSAFPGTWWPGEDEDMSTVIKHGAMYTVLGEAVTLLRGRLFRAGQGHRRL